jgi:hypothetical protein
MNRVKQLVAWILLSVLWTGQLAATGQTSGLPAPSISPIPTSAAATALFASLTGCGTANYVLTPQSGTCVAPSGQSYPAAGVMVSTGSAFGTSLTAPASAIVGISDTQTLTNKSIASTEITGVTFPAGTIVGTTDTQTLTNKSISGSEINSGSITPAIQSTSETVTFSATPTFSIGTSYSTITLTAAITTFTLASGTAGQNKILTFCQNGTGGFTVTPPSNVHGFMTNGLTASKCSSQVFNYDGVQTAWLAESPGVVNE